MYTAKKIQHSILCLFSCGWLFTWLNYYRCLLNSYSFYNPSFIHLLAIRRPPKKKEDAFQKNNRDIRYFCAENKLLRDNKKNQRINNSSVLTLKLCNLMVLNSDIPNPGIAFPFIELTSKVSHKITVSRKLIDFMFDKNNYLQLLVRKQLFLQNMKSKHAHSLQGPDPIHCTKT